MALTKEDLLEIAELLKPLERHVTDVEQHVTNMERHVTNIELTLENETNRNIQIIADCLVTQLHRIKTLRIGGGVLR